MARLKNLKEFCMDMDPGVGLNNVKWTAEHWPSLRWLPGLEVHTKGSSWLKKAHPENHPVRFIELAKMKFDK